MGSLVEEESFHAVYSDQRYILATVGSTLVAVVAGLYVVVKVLELFGYPVWLWVYMALNKIATLRLRGGSLIGWDSATKDGTQNTEGQRGANMLSSVFGLNSGSLLQKGVRGMTGALSKSSSDVPPGLGNWDNSCYQNSVIQGLASLPSLRNYLSKTTTEFPAFNIDTTNGALFDMISKLNDPENHGRHFWIRGILKSMSTFQQQDAQEYYSKILEALEKEAHGAAKSKTRSNASWLEVAKSLTSSLEDDAGTKETCTADEEDKDTRTISEQPKTAPNPLDGLLAQRVGCINCGYSEGLQLIPFNCVTVSLGREWSYDIRDCLDEYTNLEYIEGVECAKCTLLKLKGTLAPLVAGGAPFGAKLQAVEEALDDDDFDDKTLVKKFNILKKNWVQSTKSRQAVVARAPKALVLHVNRSIFDEMTGAQYKNTANVAYPRVLDLGNWCLGTRPSKSHLPDNDEEWPRDPTKSMLGDTHSTLLTSSPFQYQLRAAVTHFGTHGNGHYVCYRPHVSKPDTALSSETAEREPSGEQWWRFSDDTVYSVPESQAHQGNVFMLFYERTDEPIISTLEDQDVVQESCLVEENLPLPPPDLDPLFTSTVDDSAIAIPLPDDDSDSLPDLITSSEAPTPPTGTPTPDHRSSTAFTLKPIDIDASIYPTPPPDSPSTTQPSDYTPSEANSEDAPSTQLTSDTDDDVLPLPSTPRSKLSPGLHLMRTAGSSSERGDENRRSLPMVTAT